MESLKIFFVLLFLFNYVTGAAVIQWEIGKECVEQESFNLWFGPTIECKIKE